MNLRNSRQLDFPEISFRFTPGVSGPSGSIATMPQACAECRRTLSRPCGSMPTLSYPLEPDESLHQPRLANFHDFSCFLMIWVFFKKKIILIFHGFHAASESTSSTKTLIFDPKGHSDRSESSANRSAAKFYIGLCGAWFFLGCFGSIYTYKNIYTLIHTKRPSIDKNYYIYIYI